MSQIKVKRGNKANLPNNLPLGELAFCIDTGELYVGDGNSNPLIPMTAKEIIEARTDINGVTHPSISERLNSDYNALKALIEGQAT